MPSIRIVSPERFGGKYRTPVLVNRSSNGVYATLLGWTTNQDEATALAAEFEAAQPVSTREIFGG